MDFYRELKLGLIQLIAIIHKGVCKISIKTNNKLYYRFFKNIS